MFYSIKDLEEVCPFLWKIRASDVPASNRHADPGNRSASHPDHGRLISLPLNPGECGKIMEDGSPDFPILCRAQSSTRGEDDDVWGRRRGLHYGWTVLHCRFLLPSPPVASHSTSV